MSVVGYKTPVTRLFVQNNVQDNNIESIKATLMALCRRWIPATKGTVMWEWRYYNTKSCKHCQQERGCICSQRDNTE